MHSFYGGPQGQSFRISAIFPNRCALAEDLRQNAYSPVKLNEFVMISYGMQNLDEILKETYNSNEVNEYYKQNQKADQDQYKNNYNATLWYKIYKEDIEADSDNKVFWYQNNQYALAGLEQGEKLAADISDMKYCYICIANLSGQVPELSVEYESQDPAVEPEIILDNTNINFPIVKFKLPRAVKFHWLSKDQETGELHMPDAWNNTMAQVNSEELFTQIGVGDIIIIKENGKLYQVNNKGTDKDRALYFNENGNCEIDLVPNFEAIINNSLETYTKNNDGSYELNNPEISIKPSKDFSPIEPKYLIDFNIPKIYTPADNHIIGYYNNNGQTIYMGDSNEDDAFSFITKHTDDLSKYQFAATIPTPVSIKEIKQTHDYTQEAGNKITLKNVYTVVLNNGTLIEIPVTDGRGITKVEPIDNTDTFTLKITYNNKEFETIGPISKLPGPQGESLKIVEYRELEDTRTETDNMTEYDFVLNWVNHLVTGDLNNDGILDPMTEVDFSKYDSTNKMMCINLIKYGETTANIELINTYLAWYDINNFWWRITAMNSSNGNSNSTKLEWIDLD